MHPYVFGSTSLLAQAIALYSQALVLDPGLTAAHNNRAACLLKLGKWHEAVADCDAVLEAAPDNVKALLRRATARCGG